MMKKHRPMTDQETTQSIIDGMLHWSARGQWAMTSLHSRAYRAYRGDRSIYRHAKLRAKFGHPLR